jgi:DNA-directed RNA polymerase subunit RPC12/RpoP
MSDEDEEVVVEELVIDRPDDDARERHFPCKQCGANLIWQTGAQSLTCPYCGQVEAMPQDEGAIAEYSFNDYLATESKEQGLGLDVRDVRCRGCGAQVELAGEVAVQDCPFCGSTVLDEEALEAGIRPEAVIPFQLDRDQARAAFLAWVRSRWFAPSRLKNEARAERFKGVYRPWWTFDSHTLSHWTGQAGHYYYVTRTRTRNGKTETYRKRKTRWVSRSGTYEQFFDDQLACGFSHDGLTAEGYRLDAARPYASEVLAGFIAERYERDPQEAWVEARAAIEHEIHAACKRRLGGDTQRMFRCHTAHRGITFKLMLLPAWHSTYRFGDKTYRAVVNGQTGAVTGERPWSWLKIGLLVLAVVAVAVGIYLAFRAG